MSLVPRIVLGALDLTDRPFLTEFGRDEGNAANQSDVLMSLLADGEIESLNRRSNRTIVLTVLIEGADLAEIQESEALLVAECDRQQNTLSIDPGDGYGTTTVFDTFAAQAERVYDDNLEIATLRRWQLTIKALPFRRGDVLIVDDAGTPPSGGGTLLNDCEDDTEWSTWDGAEAEDISVDTVIFAEGAGSLTSRATGWEAGPLGILGGIPSYYRARHYDQITGQEFDTGTGGYMSVRIRLDSEAPAAQLEDPVGLSYLWAQIDSVWVAVTDYMTTERDAEGFVRYVWPVDDGLEITGLRFQLVQYVYYPTYSSGRPYVRYDDIRLIDAATTDHQIVKQLTVQGSARTAGSLRIAAATEVVALGQVLAITTPTPEIPAGFDPAAGRWWTQGDPTPDVTAIEGIYYTPDTSAYSDATGTPDRPVFNVPVGMLTAGPYTMVALVKAESSSLNFGVQAQLDVDGAQVGPTSEAEVSPTGLTTGWQFVTVGTVYLPPLPVQNADSTTTVRLLFKGAKMANVYMIPGWQVGGSPVADFSIVDCGTGTVEPGGASSSLWIDSPSTAQPQGGWWRGPTDDRANSQSAWPDAKKPGVHTFRPGGLTAFVVSTEAQGPTVTLSYYDAYL